MRDFEVIRYGEDNGNGTVFRLRTSKGTEIYGLPTPNNYGGDWDLGPTWNYLIVSEEITLVDTGSWGEGHSLIEMISDLGHDPGGLRSIIVSHGHEDHDGGLPEIIARTNSRLAAHEIYGRLISYYPGGDLPEGVKAHFPASCWHCIMPESFSSIHCVEYHRRRSLLKIDLPIDDGLTLSGGALSFCHIPGHTPDSIATLVDGEVLICGDTILPQITPHPTREAFYDLTKTILPDAYNHENTLYGLRVYMKSIKRLSKWIPHEVTTLPAHRLYYDGTWNWIDLKGRVDEIIEHHIDRCGQIISLIEKGNHRVDEIVKVHFEPSQLRGMGMALARNEIYSHVEFLEASGDVIWADGEYLESNGTAQFEACIRTLEP